jgi:zinc transporter ZupT
LSAIPVLITAAITFSATLAGGVLAVKFRRRIGILAAFTAGVLIALTFFDLLPQIFMLSQKAEASLVGALLVVALGFIFLYVLDHHLFHNRKTSNNNKGVYRSTLGLLATFEFCSHAFLEGLAIGFSFQFNLQLGIIVSAAVISHDFCDGLTTVTLMLSSGNSVNSSLGMLLIDAVAPFLGATVTFFLNLEYYYMVFFLSFLAGAFIYLGAVDLLPLAHQQNPKLVTLISLVIGFVFILFLDKMINI